MNELNSPLGLSQQDLLKRLFELLNGARDTAEEQHEKMGKLLKPDPLEGAPSGDDARLALQLGMDTTDGLVTDLVEKLRAFSRLGANVSGRLAHAESRCQAAEAQLKAARDETAALATHAQSLEARIALLQDQVAGAERDAAALRSQVDTQLGQVAELQETEVALRSQLRAGELSLLALQETLASQQRDFAQRLQTLELDAQRQREAELASLRAAHAMQLESQAEEFQAQLRQKEAGILAQVDQICLPRPDPGGPEEEKNAVGTSEIELREAPTDLPSALAQVSHHVQTQSQRIVQLTQLVSRLGESIQAASGYTGTLTSLPEPGFQHVLSYLTVLELNRLWLSGAAVQGRLAAEWKRRFEAQYHDGALFEASDDASVYRRLVLERALCFERRRILFVSPLDSGGEVLPEAFYGLYSGQWAPCKSGRLTIPVWNLYAVPLLFEVAIAERIAASPCHDDDALRAAVTQALRAEEFDAVVFACDVAKLRAVLPTNASAWAELLLSSTSVAPVTYVQFCNQSSASSPRSGSPAMGSRRQSASRKRTGSSNGLPAMQSVFMCTDVVAMDSVAAEQVAGLFQRLVTSHGWAAAEGARLHPLPSGAESFLRTMGPFSRTPRRSTKRIDDEPDSPSLPLAAASSPSPPPFRTSPPRSVSVRLSSHSTPSSSSSSQASLDQTHPIPAGRCVIQ